MFPFRFAVILFSIFFPSQSSAQQNVKAAHLSEVLTLQQVWLLNSTYTDQQHGVTFRYPSVWKSATQFGYHPLALTGSDLSQPIIGFAHEEGGFPRVRIVGPYTKTNLEGVGIVYSALPVASAAECETKAASVANNSRQIPLSAPSSVMIAGRSYSAYVTESAGMSQSISGELYATYSADFCYLFETGFAISSSVTDDISSLTPAQLHQIATRLWNMMQTVRIVRKK